MRNNIHSVKISYLKELITIIMITICIYGYLGVFNAYNIYIIAITLLLVFILQNDIFRISPYKTQKIWLAFIFIICISALQKNPYYGMLYVLVVFTGYSWGNYNFKIEFYIRILKFFKIISVIFSVFTFLNWINGKLIIELFGFLMNNQYIGVIQKDIAINRIPGLAGEVSFNAICICIGIGIVFTEILTNVKKRYFNIFILIIMYGSLMLTQKRSFILSIPVIFLLIILSKIRLRKKIKKSVLLLTITVILFIAVFFYPIFLEIDKVLYNGGSEISLSGRNIYWGIALDLAKKNPVWGAGIYKYDDYLNVITGHIGYAGAHNSYFQLLAEIGILGLVVFIIAVLISLVTTIINLRNVKSVEFQYILNISLFIQILFIIYALSGNPVHKYQQMLMYMFFVTMANQIDYLERSYEDNEGVSSTY